MLHAAPFLSLIHISLDLMLAKNHDYDEAWRSMRVSSYTDLILMLSLIHILVMLVDRVVNKMESRTMEFMDLLNEPAK